MKAVVKLKNQAWRGFEPMTSATRCSAPGYQANWDLVSSRAQSITHAFMSFSAVQKYNLSYINMYSSSSTGTLRTSNVTSSQLVEHCTGIAEVTGSDLVQACNLFLLGFTFTNVFLLISNIWSFIYSLVRVLHVYIGKMVSCVTWFVVCCCLSQKVVRAQEEIHLIEIVETVCS